METTAKVQSWMSDNPPMIEENKTVLDAVRKLHNAGYSALLIVNNGILSGIFSEKDALRLFAVNEQQVLNEPIAKHMTKNPRMVDPQDTITEAYRIMKRIHVRHVPVADKGKPVGVISIEDFIRYYDTQMDKEFLSKKQSGPLVEKEGIDPLTGGFNAEGFNNAASALIHNAGGPVFLAVLDIDFFKTLKIEFGYSRAYDMVVAMGNACAKQFKQQKIVIGRIERDVIAAAVAISDIGLMHQSLEELRLKIDEEEIIYSKNVTMSIGFTQCRGNEKITLSLHRAKRALREAKEAGRNCIRFLDT